MPLIQDLKNSAMRDRHWSEIKEHVQKPFDEQGTVITILMMNVDLSVKAYSIHRVGKVPAQIERGIQLERGRSVRESSNIRELGYRLSRK